ncbi:hypothetical protein V491_09185 [Pseudogymnoascus sp. VKM F-3775]|nr:hypothetical protein V491_09185 [Pseudogymnoascus sp. VKM F-3775]
MLSYTLLAGLLVTSTVASPFEIPAVLQPREGRKHCSAPVLNANEPNEYCYQFCDFKTVRKVGKPVSVSINSLCDPGPKEGCAVQVLNQETIEVSTTETHGTTDTKTVDGSVEIFGAKIGASYSHWVEQSTASTHGLQTSKASTSWLYVPQGKSGHVVFFPFYEEHCGIAAAMRKPNLHDDKDFDCNADYNILFDNDAKLDRIRGMQYNWDGIHEGDIYNYVDFCVSLPIPDINGEAQGQFQMCDSDNTDNKCNECIGCEKVL